MGVSILFLQQTPSILHAVPAQVRRTAVLAALLLGGPAAASRAAGGPGSSSAEFLRIGVGARPTGMAEAFSGLADDVHALAYNPAGLAFLRRRELGLVHNAYAPGIRHEWAGYAHPTTWGTFGLSANMLYVSDFESYDAFDRPSGKTSAADAAYQLAYAASLTENWALGIAAKHVSSRLHETSAAAYAADAGLLWRPLPRLRLGVSLLDTGSGLRHLSDTASLPTTLRAGASWSPFDPRDFRHAFTLAFDMEKRRDESGRVAGALEMWYENTLALRVGGRSQPASGTGLTLGLGLYLFRDENRGCELGFDYAFVAAGDFAQSHRAGLVLKFGRPVTDDARASLLPKSEVLYEDVVHPSRTNTRRRGIP